jgi:hypothetical protein
MEYINLFYGHNAEIIEHKFDGDHHGHPVVVIPEAELKRYKNVNEKY